MVSLINRSAANAVTLLNITFGSLSLLSTIHQNYIHAALFIILAVFMDSADGKIARSLNSCSDMGKQLDSLCDMVSFGVAPAMLIYAQVLSAYSSIGLLAATLFIICGAYRLARFNVLNISDSFVGVPITFAGLITAILSLCHQHISSLFVLCLFLILAALMVSKLKIAKW